MSILVECHSVFATFENYFYAKLRLDERVSILGFQLKCRLTDNLPQHLVALSRNIYLNRRLFAFVFADEA